MFIETFISQSVDRLGRTHSRQMGRCRCDVCNSEFTRGNYDWSKFNDEPEKLVFCSSDCSRVARKRGGLSDKKLREANIKKFGVEHTLQLERIQETSKTTLKARYGVTHPMKSPNIRNRATQTIVERYGVASAFHVNRDSWDYEQINAKRLETMKRRGTICSSEPEEKAFLLLKERFPLTERQVRIPNTHWVIDFYIPEINTYVQVDGTYWHGLDRPFEVIAASTKPRDRKIVRAWNTDRQQDAWFTERNMRLVRITDKEVERLQDVSDFLNTNLHVLDPEAHHSASAKNVFLQPTTAST